MERNERAEENEENYKLPAKLQGKKNLQRIISEGIGELSKEEVDKLRSLAEKEIILLKEKGRRQLNPTDADARIISANGRMTFSYNAQGVVESKEQIIVGAKATNLEADNHLLCTMIEEAKKTSGVVAEETLADSGYFSGNELSKAEESGYGVLVNIPGQLSKKEKGYRKEDFKYLEKDDFYICPNNKKMGLSKTYLRKGRDYIVKVYTTGECVHCQLKGNCSKSKTGRRIERYEYEDALERQREKQKETENKTKLANRGKIVEPVFGWIKHNNNINRWLYRGLESVDAQWGLICTAVNLRKIFRLWAEKRLVFC